MADSALSIRRWDPDPQKQRSPLKKVHVQKLNVPCMFELKKEEINYSPHSAAAV